MLELPIVWIGPYTPEQVIHDLNDGGSAPAYAGEDYGLYQIYGAHILGDTNSLLYIGKATQQTFSARFQQHRTWLQHEDAVQIYVGRIHVPSGIPRPVTGRHGLLTFSWQSVS
ncbi:MAG: hypothetical protein M3434_13645 [Gemmatimonadota bacterium]|nr:hypothetical protein [Gemmatimonadota bacterium]